MPRLLSIQRGSSVLEGTIENYRKCLDIFYQYLKESGKTLKDISARHMVPFLIELEQHYNDGRRRPLIIFRDEGFFQFLCFHQVAIGQPTAILDVNSAIKIDQATENTLSDIFRSRK